MKHDEIRYPGAEDGKEGKRKNSGKGIGDKTDKNREKEENAGKTAHT